jgi:hypothetical protein
MHFWKKGNLFSKGNSQMIWGITIMNRLNFLFLAIIIGCVTLSAKADPILISQVGDFDRLDPKAEKRYIDQRVGELTAPPRIVKGKLLSKPAKATNEVTNTLPSTVLDKKPDLDWSIPKRDNPTTKPNVGDFGGLPTNSYKQNKDLHPSDFQTVPVEGGTDTRKAK